MLLGGLSAGALTSAAVAQAPRVTTESYYTNDDHLPGAGFYHAPFRGFFPQPYNSYDANRKMYFYGGQWGPTPYLSIVNISSPTPEAVKAAESVRTDYVRRSGFGNTSRSHFTSS